MQEETGVPASRRVCACEGSAHAHVSGALPLPQGSGGGPAAPKAPHGINAGGCVGVPEREAPSEAVCVGEGVADGGGGVGLADGS